MAFGYQCKRCGYEQEAHRNDLVLEDFPWIGKVEPGYRMTILRCMETPLPKRYQRSASEETAHMLVDDSHPGYVSPSLREEEKKHNEELEKPWSPPTCVYIAPLLGGGSVALRGE